MQFSRWPNIERAPAWLLRELHDGAVARGWDPDALVGHIATESGFDPQARARTSSAVGLAQWTDATLRALLGVRQRAKGEDFDVAKQVQEWTAEEQLPLVWSLFERIAGPAGLHGADFKVSGFGAPPAASDAYVIGDATAAPGSQKRLAYDANKPLDLNADGKFTAGDVRAWWKAVADRAKKQGPFVVSVDRSEPPGQGGDVAGLLLGAGSLLGLVLALRKGKRR